MLITTLFFKKRTEKYKKYQSFVNKYIVFCLKYFNYWVFLLLFSFFIVVVLFLFSYSCSTSASTGTDTMVVLSSTITIFFFARSSCSWQRRSPRSGSGSGMAGKTLNELAQIRVLITKVMMTIMMMMVMIVMLMMGARLETPATLAEAEAAAQPDQPALRETRGKKINKSIIILKKVKIV